MNPKSYSLSTNYNTNRPYQPAALTYRVIQEESALLWEMIVWVILSKKIHTDMGPILNGYGVMTA